MCLVPVAACTTLDPSTPTNTYLYISPRKDRQSDHKMLNHFGEALCRRFTYFLFTYLLFDSTLKVHFKVISSNQNWNVLRDFAYTSGRTATTICRDYTNDNSKRTLYIPKLFTCSFTLSQSVGISVESVAIFEKSTIA